MVMDFGMDKGWGSKWVEGGVGLGWRWVGRKIALGIKMGWVPTHLHLHVCSLYVPKNHKISLLHSFVTSKNVSWLHFS